MVQKIDTFKVLHYCPLDTGVKYVTFTICSINKFITEEINFVEENGL